jgi:Fe-S oxidoreductase
MLRGELITDGWASTAVAEALEWCLGCKGCKSECPTHTDMAMYKAEFLSHYYEQRQRPRAAQIMGRIGEWAPLAAGAPWLANALTRTPGLRALTKRFAGVAPERPLPRFAARSLRASFARRRARNGGDAVVLFADTFNDFFRPQAGLAAADVLEAAGCRVEMPRERICCGRPYYDVGLLGPARAALERVLQVLAPAIEAGTPIVVLEPGCLSVFRDELGQLFPDDARAARLAAQVHPLAAFLQARGWTPPRASGRVLLHGHCHQKALYGLQAEQDLLRAAGYTVLAPDAGCCGMAGAFGFKPQHLEASRRIAERVLLPALRAEERSTPVVADGFSCREQIEDLAARPTLHLAELLSGAQPRDRA